MRDAIADAIARILAEHCTPETVRRIEAGGDHRELWRELENSGFADALIPESSGGAGLSLADAIPVPELCGRHAVPVPLAETMVLRGLLAGAGVELPAGSITFGIGAVEDANGLRCAQIACGKVADWVLVESGGQCRLLPTKEAEPSPATFALDAGMRWSSAAIAQAAPFAVGEELRLAQAFAYAVQLSGALTAVFERTLQYANDRQQFGKPIGKFQAIQHQLSVMSEHVFAARMATEVAASGGGVTYDRLKVAIAKARTSEAVIEVAALSHSIHGAIGFTEEYDLQLLTRRLHAWRQAAGAESYWHDVVGETLLTADSPLSLDLLWQATKLA